jgi:hypothetical protein
MSGSVVGRLYVTHCKSQCRVYPARCYVTRCNVVIISVSYTRNKRDANQNGETFLISGRERSSPQVSIMTLFDLSMREPYTWNYTTYAYATDPTRANAIRAPTGPAVLMASPEPKNSPVPNVPAIWKTRGQRIVIAWRQRTCSYPVIRDAWVQKRTACTVADVHLDMPFLELSSHKVNGSDIQWQVIARVDLRWFDGRKTIWRSALWKLIWWTALLGVIWVVHGETTRLNEMINRRESTSEEDVK